MRQRFRLLLLLAAVALAACQAPPSTEFFVGASERAADGYHFELTLDTAQVYEGYTHLMMVQEMANGWQVAMKKEE